MRTWVLVVVVAGLAACNFDSSGDYIDDPKLRPNAGAGGMDGGALPSDSGTAGQPKPDASTVMDAAVDANQPRNDAAIDGGQFGDNPTPDDPEPPMMTGGLKCADVFCPFAAAPMEPCCTKAGDVEGGAAREMDRCGLSFSKLSSDFFGQQCWQRDQAGVVDEYCPPVQVDLHSADPGCCTDKGICGGVDSDFGLGCHTEPGAETKSCGSTPPEDDAGVGDQCELTGRYALEFTVDMAWGGRSGGLWELTDDGRGKLRIMLLLDIDQVDDGTLALRGTIKPCAVELPAFYSSTLCEAYQPVFPTRLWESAQMPEFDITGKLQCEQPGCILTIDARTSLLGIALDNPEAPWPTADQTDELTCAAGSGQQCFPDHDGDTRAGLTVEIAKGGRLPATGSTCRSGYTKEGAPLSSSSAAIFDGVRRSDRLQLGVRMKLGGSVTLGEMCAKGTGSAIAQFVNSRAWGCQAQQGTANYPFGRPAGANDNCTATEAGFMDANLPVYKILAFGEKPPTTLELADQTASKGPQARLVRLGALDADVSCADVRAAPLP